jgi:hypothetical protein
MFEPLPEPDEPSFEEPPRLLREPAGDATDSGPHPAVVPEPVDIVPSELRRPGIVFRTRAALGLLLVVALAGVGLATAIGLGIAVLALVLRRAVGS